MTLKFPVNINRRFRMKLVDGLKLFVELAAVAVLAVLCARLIWLFLAPSGAVSGLSYSPVSPRPVQNARPVIKADLSVLSRENAFGVASGTMAGDVPDAPETKLNFRLVGLRAVTGEGQGSATIVTPDGKQARFVVGDQVIPNVKIEQILADRVVLNHNGTQESLLLGPGRGKLSVLGGDKLAEPAQSAADPPPQASGKVVRSAVSQDFLSYIALSGAGPEIGGPGYQISPRGDEKVFAEAGFEAGDIITRINEQNVSDVRLDEIYAQFQSNSVLSLDVRRGNETLKFELTVS